jgi:hypothetical protein
MAPWLSLLYGTLLVILFLSIVYFCCYKKYCYEHSHTSLLMQDTRISAGYTYLALLGMLTLTSVVTDHLVHFMRTVPIYAPTSSI